MRLAKRLSVIEPSMTLKVSAKAAELKAKGIDVVSFGAGEPDFDTPEHIKEAAKKALDAGATKYTQVEGTPQLRKAAAAWFSKAHGFDVSPAEVMVSAGAKQVIFNAFHARPGRRGRGHPARRPTGSATRRSPSWPAPSRCRWSPGPKTRSWSTRTRWPGPSPRARGCS